MESETLQKGAFAADSAAAVSAAAAEGEIPSPSVATGPQKKKKPGDLRKVENLIGWLYISPMIVGILVFTAIPLIMSILAMFYQWNGRTPLLESEFVGFANFVKLFNGSLDCQIFWTSFRNTLIFTIQLPISLIIGLLLALAMNRDMKGVQTFRVLYYLPGVMSIVAVTIVWQTLFAENGGTINTALMNLGLKPVAWLSSDFGVAFTVNFLIVWKGVGYTALMFIAGLQSVSTDQIEAAKIDGASSWTILLKITVPALYPTIFYLTVTGLMGSLQMFNEAFILVGDGVKYNGWTVVGFVYSYTDLAHGEQYGLSSVAAWVLALIIFIITAIQLYVDKKREAD